MKKFFALCAPILCMTISYGQNGVGIDVANPLEMLDVAGAIKIGTTSTNNAGTIRWTGTEFQGYDGTQWVTFTGGTGGSVTLDEAYDEGGSGAGRVITADNGAIRINGDDGFLVTGTHGSGDAIEVSGAGAKMFFNPRKSAFRTGRTTGTNWDDANIGNYSFAAGYNPMASANYSVALGYQVQATGSSSVALGLGGIASGDESFAVGEEAVASGVHAMAIGTSTVSSGLGTVAIGNTSHATNDYAVSVGNSTFSSGYGSVSLGNQIRSKSGYETVVGRWNEDYTPISTTTWNDEDRLFSIGNGTSASNRSNALTVLKLGYVGIGTSTPSTTLEVVGQVKITGGTPGVNKVLTSDATGLATWTDPETLVTDNANTLDEAYDEGGAGAGRVITADNGAIRINGDDGFLVTGTHGSGDAIEVSGTGTRMFFNPKKSAFRAGNVSATQWDDANIGEYSTAMGKDVWASGMYSTVFGSSSSATGIGSFAAGVRTGAAGNYSFAMGYESAANGPSSIALGDNNVASGEWSIAIGHLNTSTHQSDISIGYSNQSTGNSSVAIGIINQATNTGSMAFGESNQSSGYNAVAIGSYSKALGDVSFAMGFESEARADYETVVGIRNELYTPTTDAWNPTDRLFSVGNGSSIGSRSNALTILKNGNTGIGTTTPTTRLHIVGTEEASLTDDGHMMVGAESAANLIFDTNEILARNNGAATTLFMQNDGGSLAVGEDAVAADQSIALGLDATATGNRSLALGASSYATAELSTAIGFWNEASNVGATSIGWANHATNWDAYAIGLGNYATGAESKAFGNESRALGISSFAIGNTAESNGQGAFAIGNDLFSQGLGAFAIGNSAVAEENYSFAIGTSVLAQADYSFALGVETRASSYFETVVGSYNELYTPASSTTWNNNDRIFSVGNGNSSSRSNALTILKNGNTGIGTSTPSTTLEVAGQVKITGGTPGLNKVFTSDATGLASWVDPNTLVTGLPSATSGQTLRHNGSSWVANSNLFNNGSNVGIGETSPQATLHVKNGTTNQLRIESTGGEADMHFLGDAGVTWQAGTNNAGNGSTSGNQFYIYDSAYRLTVQSGTGNVGVGTSSPQSKLEIENGYNLSLSQPGFIGIGGATGRNITIDRDDIQGRNNGSAAQIDLQYFGGDLSACVGGGNVGIGIASPSQKLHVNGNLKVAGSYIYGAGSQYAFIGDSPTSSGGVTITPHAPNYGTLGTPSYYWDDAYVSEFYYQTQYTFSDRRVKQNIQPMDSALEKVMLLNGVTYDINTDKHPFYQNLKEDEVEDTKNIMGFIAQEIQEVFPGMVRENDETGFLMVKNYEQLFPVLVEAVKELKLENDLLKARIDVIEQSSK